jgi:hypothetical protein
MRSRRPPEILRKSHAHGAGKERAKAKAALKRHLETETGVEETEVAPDDDTQSPRRGDKQARPD